MGEDIDEPTTSGNKSALGVGAIVDIQQAKDSGLLNPGDPGYCFGEQYQETAPECQLCYESDRCAQRFLDKFSNYIVPISEYEKQAAAQRAPVADPGLLKVPDSFREFENELLKMHHVARFPRIQSVLYMCKDKRMLSIMEPMSDDSITVVLHGCEKKDFKDPKNNLWVTDKFPGKVFLFVLRKEYKAAINIILQHHRALEAKTSRVNPTKYQDAKSKIKTNAL